MASRKRRFEEDSLEIRLATADGDSGRIVADRNILAAFSSCVRGLPAEATEWDISKLVVEGQAVEQPIVLAWLNAMYMQIQDEPCEQLEVNPASNMRGLAQLLAFADAVGSSRGLLRSLSAELDDLVAEVQLEQLPAADNQEREEEDSQLWTGLIRELQACAYYKWLDGSPLMLTEWFIVDDEGEIVANLGTTERKAALVQQVAQQLEVLLYYAHTLKLPALQRKLHGFIQINTSASNSLLYGSLAVVVSDRVVAAVADQDFCKRAVINSIVTEQGGTMEHEHCHVEALLQPDGVSVVPNVEFQALLSRDAFGSKQGHTVMVSLSLSGDESTEEPEPWMRINGQKHVVQLLIGPLVRDDTAAQALMGPTPAEGSSSTP